MLLKQEKKEVMNVIAYLKTVKTYASFNEKMDEALKSGNKELQESIAKEAYEAFDDEKLIPIIFFNNDQMKLFKEEISKLDNIKSHIFIKEDTSDEILRNDNLMRHIVKLQTVKDYVDFYKNRMIYGVTKKQLNSTMMMFVSKNTTKDYFNIEVFPANFLESLFIAYFRHHQFIDSNDKELKKEILNLVKNSKLDFDHSLYPFFNDILKLLKK